jgi:hypothetical protein
MVYIPMHPAVNTVSPVRVMWKAVVGWLVLAALVLILLAVVVKDLLIGPNEDVAIAQCRVDYARARNSAESLAVDGRQPVVSRTQASIALTCAARRKAGQLSK